jgi:hypothetical protein
VERPQFLDGLVDQPVLDQPPGNRMPSGHAFIACFTEPVGRLLFGVEARNNFAEVASLKRVPPIGQINNDLISRHDGRGLDLAAFVEIEQVSARRRGDNLEEAKSADEAAHSGDDAGSREWT